MIASVHRRVGIATTAALIVGLMAVTPASANVAPMEPGSYCQSISAGYRAVGAWQETASWIWDGRLALNMCVNRTGSGTHYGSVQLSAPSGFGLTDFWGVVRIYLQANVSGWPTVSQAIWQVAGTARGTLSNGRYWWNWQTTPTTSAYMTGSFRVMVTAYATISGSGWAMSLFKGYPPAAGMGYYYGSFLAP